MRILLTGHKGYVGGHLHTAFERRYDLDAFDEGTKYARWMQKFMKRGVIPHPEIIIHCGANPDSTYTKPDIFQWNYDATRRIADYAANHNIHLIFFSSSCAIRPECHYGWSKRVSEDYIRSRLKGRYTILRIFNIYGEENGRTAKSVPKLLADRELEQLYVPLTRDYIHVHDVVQAVSHVMNNDIYGTYEVGTGVPTQVRDLANLVGWRPETTIEPPDGIPEYKVAALANMLPGFECEKNIFAELPMMAEKPGYGSNY